MTGGNVSVIMFPFLSVQSMNIRHCSLNLEYFDDSICANGAPAFGVEIPQRYYFRVVFVCVLAGRLLRKHVFFERATQYTKVVVFFAKFDFYYPAF